jgi:hypothetical protein
LLPALEVADSQISARPALGANACISATLPTLEERIHATDAMVKRPD